MANSSVDLASLFGNVAQVLMQNKEQLNSDDTQNNDHGDNMVKVFNTITQALEKKSNGSPSAQLEYASQQVQKKCQSGSGTVYAEGLARAAGTLEGQSINSSNAMQLITSLLGSSGTAGQSSSTPESSSDLGGLLGTLLGGSSEPQQTGSNAPADALSSLLGGLMGGNQQSSQQQSNQGGINLSQILAAGMEFMQSQQQGQDTMSSLLDAVVAGSQAGSGYRAQSGKLVANTLLQGLGTLLAKR
jgi:uncharacterized protein YfiM (DUF2279 family)